MRFEPIITSLLTTDAYKLSMGQAIYHQFPGDETAWTFKCRNKDVHFSNPMVQEIKKQIKAYCGLRFTEDELAYLSKIKWMKRSYIDFLRLWRPNFNDFDIQYNPASLTGLSLETHGTWLNTSMYEIPVLAIVNEVYFRMKYDYDDLLQDYKIRLDAKLQMLRDNNRIIGNFSEFGLRRRLSGEAQDHLIHNLKEFNEETRYPTKLSHCVGTSNVYLAKKYGMVPTGTQAHEWIMCVGQGNHKHNPAYSNWYAMEHWVKEYGILNGTALTDTITTDCFLRDFQLTYATLFSGVRHDSGNPYEWGEKFVKHYTELGIDPKTKTLLFSDSLDFDKADRLYAHFKDKAKVAFGIGTYLSNDTFAEPLNIVMKVTECNGMPVAKVSDTPGKGMCKDPAYVDYLERSIKWRMEHEE
ncbi:MAG: nicotinate phosphoribosyltransferase [Clostridia bacterium]|nr:nicotinate phosphoribosyltransferase [Clostridia bacterium]